MILPLDWSGCFTEGNDNNQGLEKLGECDNNKILKVFPLRYVAVLAVLAVECS